MSTDTRMAGATPELPGDMRLYGKGPPAMTTTGRRGWIVSPRFDLLFFINIYWVVAFLPFYASADGELYIQFWMAYFLATPHRWLTLVVAATDRDRRYGQTWLFVVIAVFCALLIGGTLWVVFPSAWRAFRQKGPRVVACGVVAILLSAALFYSGALISPGFRSILTEMPYALARPQ